MADQARQSKLASAKKKLKEFQQKNPPTSEPTGAKKKRKGKDDICGDRQTEIKSFLKLLASDVSLTNGLAIAPKARQECEAAQLDCESYVDPNLTNPEHASDCTTEQTLSSAAADVSKSLINEFSERLVQNSQPFRQYLPQSCENGNSLEFSNVKEYTGYQESVEDHVSTLEKLEKQTISTLLSEKAELQSALANAQEAVQLKSVEVEELESHLESTRHTMSELSSVSTLQEEFEKRTKQLEQERDNLQLEAEKLNEKRETAEQRSTELAEQLSMSSNQNSAMKLELHELRQKLEAADHVVQQLSNKSTSASDCQQDQQLLEVKQQLEARIAQLLEMMSQLQKERDQFAAQVQDEGRAWKDSTEQLLSQISLVSAERDQSVANIQELQAWVAELDKVALNAKQCAENDVDLQEALSSLRQEKEELNSQYKAQVRDNEQLSRLCHEQEERLLELESQVQHRADEAQAQKRSLEEAESEKATVTRVLTQNRELKEQLAELQNAFVRLTNENVELTTGLQSEHHVKKEVSRKMAHLQEELHNVKEQLEARLQELQSTQLQKDQCLAYLQQYTASYQQLAVEREELHKRLLCQAQLTDRLQHDEALGRAQLAQAQAKLAQLAKGNEELKTEVQELQNSTRPASTRDEGDGLETQPFPEGFHKSSLAIPEDFQSKEELEEFLQMAMSQLEREKGELYQQLMEERRLHYAAVQQVAALSQTHSHHQGTYTIADSGVNTVPAEVYDTLKIAMEKLQQRFSTIMQERAELTERLEELEHRCIQLSGETDTIGEYIALYQNQRAIMKQKHLEKEQYINMLAKDKEDMKMKLAELQDLVLQLVEEKREWYRKCVGNLPVPSSSVEQSLTAHNTELLSANPEETELGMPMDLAPTESVSRLCDGQEGTAEASTSEQRQGEEDGTARQIMQLLQEIRNPQAHRAHFLDNRPCVPFFYRPDMRNQVKILVI